MRSKLFRKLTVPVQCELLQVCHQALEPPNPVRVQRRHPYQLFLEFVDFGFTDGVLFQKLVALFLRWQSGEGRQVVEVEGARL